MHENRISLALAALLALARLASAQTDNAGPADAKPLPAIDFLLQQVVARAVSQEDKNDNLFDMNYQYIRTRTWEYRNGCRRIEKPRAKKQRGKQGAALAAWPPVSPPAKPAAARP